MATLVSNRPVTRHFGPRHRWVVLAVGVAAQASFSAMFSGIPVTGVIMRADYHLSTAALGFVVGCLGLGVAASDIAWGLLTDRFGDRRILLTGLIATGVLLAGMAVVAVPNLVGVGVLAACMLMAGALGGSVNGSSGRAIMTWFTDGQRGLAMSIRQTAIPAGGAVGVALLPGIAGSWGFRAVYATLAIFCLLSAAATARWLHEPENAAVRTIGHGAGPSPLRRWEVWRVALASALLTVPQIAVLSFTAIFLHDARGAGAVAAAVTVIVAQLGGGAARIWTGHRTDRGASRRGFLRGIGLLTALTMAGAATLTHAPLPLTIGALALSGLLANAWHGVAYTEIAVLAGADRAGTALGLEGTTVFGAAFITPLLVPALLGVTSWPAVWGLLALSPLVAVALAPRRSRA